MSKPARSAAGEPFELGFEPAASTVHERGVFVALGANLGDRAANLRAALAALAATDEIDVVAVSPVYETAPVGGPADQPRYLNMAAELATSLDPHALLDRAQQIEAELGRERMIANGPRTIDIDILLFRNEHIDDSRLIVPHPRMHEREFVLRPLRDLRRD